MKNLATIALLAIAATCLPAWTFASNQEVAEQIGNRLRESGRLHDFRIKILFQDGTATLSGSVGSPSQIDQAVEMARGVPGVRRVVNELKIAPELTKSVPMKPDDLPGVADAKAPATRPTGTVLHSREAPIGSLGFRLGSPLTLEGNRDDDFKTGDQTLLIDTVNGKRLGEHIAIWVENVELPPPQFRCVLKGYENGQDDRRPTRRRTGGKGGEEGWRENWRSPARFSE